MLRSETEQDLGFVSTCLSCGVGVSLGVVAFLEFFNVRHEAVLAGDGEG